MRTCALCEEPLPGRFCERCYPQFASRPVPKGPGPVPVLVTRQVDPAEVARAAIVTGLLVLAAAAGYLGAWALWGGADHAGDGDDLAAALAWHRENGAFDRWDPGDRVVVETRVLTIERLQMGEDRRPGDTGAWFVTIASDGSGIVLLDAAMDDLKGSPRIRFELNVVERPDPRTGEPVEWFAEDRNGGFPGIVFLYLEDVRISR